MNEQRVVELLRDIAGLAQDESPDINDLHWSFSEIHDKAMKCIWEINGSTLELKDE